MSAPYTGQYAVLNQYTPLTQKYGAEYGVDPTLLDALIWRESGGNKMATNGSAMGLTQFTPIAMAQYGVSDPYDPAQSIKGAAEYLSDYSSAGVSGALQAYNAGAPGKTTETVGGVPYEDAVISTAQSLEAQSGATAPAGSLSAGIASQVPGSTSLPASSAGASSVFDSAMAGLGSAVGASASDAGTPVSNAAPDAKEGATVSQALGSASSYWGNELLSWIESLFSTYGPEIIGVTAGIILLYLSVKGSVSEGA